MSALAVCFIVFALATLAMIVKLWLAVDDLNEKIVMVAALKLLKDRMDEEKRKGEKE